MKCEKWGKNEATVHITVDPLYERKRRSGQPQWFRG